ncbi:hypothetical protein HYDPIDRAFT_106581 [Hydnomerulius pinastri MD-312]|nr:hypothetical protein HYDPIDRAFT_106581 [Hydnomerulius pinastri MD-312]
MAPERNHPTLAFISITQLQFETEDELFQDVSLGSWNALCLLWDVLSSLPKICIWRDGTCATNCNFENT